MTAEVNLGNEVWHALPSVNAQNLAVMLKDPTGCGKTRFVEYMAWRLGRPLVTSCATTTSLPATWSDAS
jgi:ATP-dependent protease Clp ATPase subunit